MPRIRVARLQQREEDRLVRLRARVRLHVGVARRRTAASRRSMARARPRRRTRSRRSSACPGSPRRTCWCRRSPGLPARRARRCSRRRSARPAGAGAGLRCGWRARHPGRRRPALREGVHVASRSGRPGVGAALRRDDTQAVRPRSTFDQAPDVGGERAPDGEGKRSSASSGEDDLSVPVENGADAVADLHPLEVERAPVASRSSTAGPSSAMGELAGRRPRRPERQALPRGRRASPSRAAPSASGASTSHSSGPRQSALRSSATARVPIRQRQSRGRARPMAASRSARRSAIAAGRGQLGQRRAGGEPAHAHGRSCALHRRRSGASFGVVEDRAP